MLKIIVPATEAFDESKNEFVEVKKEQTLKMEHSLVSLSKWESKWNKSFFSKQAKTYEETLDYIKCMTITSNVDPDIFTRLTKQNIDKINDYINAPMTATTFSNEKGKPNNRLITSELIYYWMITLNIPFECEKWHLNRLLTLIRVCNAENQPNKKMSQRQIMQNNAALNAARRKKFNSKG